MTRSVQSRSLVGPALFILVAVLLLGSGPVRAAGCVPSTIDIDAVPDGGYGTFVVGVYQFTSPSPGSPNDMAVSGGVLFTTSSPENTLEITRTDGGSFTFVDLTGETFQPTPWDVTGSLDNVVVAEDTYSSVGVSTFTASNLAGVEIDKITIIINQATGSNLAISELNFGCAAQSVPGLGPALSAPVITLVAMLLGLGGLGLRGKRAAVAR